MLIVCPSCASEYMIDPGRLGAEGRTVRCAGCKSTWFVAPEVEDTSSAAAGADGRIGNDDAPDGWDDAPAAPSGEPAFRSEADERDAWIQAAKSGRVEARNGRVSRLSAFAGPLLILAVVCGTGAALWGRAQVVRMVPVTAAIYAGIGLPVNLRGLEFRDVRSELAGAGADMVLVVEGAIANISGRDAAVPPIEIGLKAAEGQMLYTWSNDPPRQSLTDGEVVPFRARLAAPPGEARQVLVRFAPSREGAAAVASTTR
jgi:predicted Zn finger-like uncharacterized protein